MLKKLSFAGGERPVTQRKSLNSIALSSINGISVREDRNVSRFHFKPVSVEVLRLRDARRRYPSRGDFRDLRVRASERSRILWYRTMPMLATCARIRLIMTHLIMIVKPSLIKARAAKIHDVILPQLNTITIESCAREKVATSDGCHSSAEAESFAEQRDR